jgi:hypothetical protein
MAVDYTPVRVSNLPNASALSDTDSFPVVQAGVTKKATGAQIRTFSNALSTVVITVINVASSGSVTLNAASFVSAMIITGSTGAVKVGTTGGGGEIIDDAIVTGTPLVYPGTGIFSITSQTLYFTGTFKIRLMIWNIGE